MRDSEIIKKPLLIRFNELIVSLAVIKDSLESIVKGNYHQFIPLYGQLRAILTDNAKKNIPLLKELADNLNFKLSLYYIESNIIPLDNANTSVFHISHRITLKKEFEDQTEIELFDLLKKTLILFNKDTYTYSEIIEILANKSGGAHFASKIEKFIAKLFAFNNNFLIFGHTILENFFYEFGKIIFELSYEILHKFASIYLIFNIKPLFKIDDISIIFDYFRNDSSYRITIFIDNNSHIGINLTDFNGYVLTCISESQTIEANKLLLIEISIDLKKDLYCEVNIFVNNKLHASVVSETPFLILNEIQDYLFYINRSIELKDNGLHLAIGSIAAFDKIMESEERLEILTSFIYSYENQKSMIELSKGNFGEKKTSGALNFLFKTALLPIEKGLINYYT